MIDILVFIYFIFYVIIGLRCALLSDELIKWLYDNDIASWKLLGKPRGLFFNPPNSSYLSYTMISFKLSFFKPIWIDEDNDTGDIFLKFNFWKNIGLYLSLLMLPMIFLAINLN